MFKKIFIGLLVLLQISLPLGYAASTATCFDTDTKLMLHGNGTDGSTSFIDSSTNGYSISVNGNAQIDTAQSKFGGASILFDGTGDGISAPDSADWAFGTNDITIDFWARFNSVTSTNNVFMMFRQCENSSNKAIFFHKAGADHDMQLTVASGGSTVFNFESSANSFNPSTGVWYHITLTRSGTSFKFFVDGTQLTGGSFTSSSSWPDLAATFNLALGDTTNCSGVADDFNGWIDEFRVINGTAVWTSNFTPPSAEYIACANRRRITGTTCD